VLVDAPLVVADTRRALLETTFERANQEAEEDFRELLLSLCGDRSDRGKRAMALDEGFVPAPLVERIIAHNYHVVEPPPIDGCVPESDTSVCGLWPLGSIVNHSLRPNVTRSFAGHANCYRLLRDVAAGEELFDNYLDPRLPRSERAAILAKVHFMDDEGPDDCDAPAEFMAEIEQARSRVGELLQEDRAGDAFQLLAEVSSRCRACGRRDPAFAEIFRAHADVAGQLQDDAHLRLRCLTTALEFATTREPFSTVSCMLAVELLAATLEAVQPSDPAAGLERAEEVAREHFRGVYGAEEGTFEALNPGFSEQLRAAWAARGRGAPVSGGQSLESMD